MRRILLTSTTLLAAAALAACAGGDTAADSAAADTSATAGAAGSDPTQATAGGGVPAGYVGQADDGDIAQVNYTAQGNQWEVRTGPAHIVYAAGDTASGSYTVSASVEQMEQPQHPEAFGLILGGQNLDQSATRAYTYFLVRHTGEYMIRVREGADLRTIRDWTASPAVPRSDSTGRATYRLSARVGADAVQFMVNDQEVVSVPKASIPTDGVAGLRINHNLHVSTGPVTITRG